MPVPTDPTHSNSPPVESGPTTATASRLEWVDTAKGIAIILVVMFHAVTFLRDIGLAGPWVSVSGPLETFRMPLFFFASGLFAQNALAMQFRDLVRRRIARLVWLYVLWTSIYAVALLFIPVYREYSSVHPVLRWLTSLVWPNPSTWFVYALALYFALAWAIRALPVVPQLVLAVIPAIPFALGLWVTPNEAVEKIATYFIFFLLAVHLARHTFRRAARSNWISVAATALLYAGIIRITRELEIEEFPGIGLITGIAAVAFGVSLSSGLSRLRLMEWLTRLGRHTLAIYLVHFYVVLGCVAVLAIMPVGGVQPAIWVPAVTALGVLIPLGVERAAARLTWLWAVPQRLTGGVEAAPSRVRP